METIWWFAESSFRHTTVSPPVTVTSFTDKPLARMTICARRGLRDGRDGEEPDDREQKKHRAMHSSQTSPESVLMVEDHRKRIPDSRKSHVKQRSGPFRDL